MAFRFLQRLSLVLWIGIVGMSLGSGYLLFVWPGSISFAFYTWGILSFCFGLGAVCDQLIVFYFIQRDTLCEPWYKDKNMVGMIGAIAVSPFLMLSGAGHQKDSYSYESLFPFPFLVASFVCFCFIIMGISTIYS